MEHLATILLQTTTLGPTGFDFPLVPALTAAIALPVKFMVDVVKGWEIIPSSTLPIVGIVIGYGFCILILIGARVSFDSAVYAQCGIAAVGAQIAAMAATWNQTRAAKVEERIQVALDLPQGSSKDDVNAKVFEKES